MSILYNCACGMGKGSRRCILQRKATELHITVNKSRQLTRSSLSKVGVVKVAAGCAVASEHPPA
jgi:hypothetical protein